MTGQPHARTRLPPGKNTGIHGMWDLVDPSVELDVSEKQKIGLAYQNSKSGPSSQQGSLYTYNAISAVLREKMICKWRLDSAHTRICDIWVQEEILIYFSCILMLYSSCIYLNEDI
jgi:hypothetical protein